MMRVIEDSVVGVTAALAAGIEVVLYDPQLASAPMPGVEVIGSNGRSSGRDKQIWLIESL